MTQSKKLLDSRKRQLKKRMLRSVIRKRAAQKRMGRPAINEQQLLADRDSLLNLLGNNWERIGWRLLRARSMESLRKAFCPLKQDASQSYRISDFLRIPFQKATPVQIRKTKKALAIELQNSYAIQQKYNLLIEKYEEAATAQGLATEGSRNVLSAEFKKRGDEFEKCERELFASNYRLSDLERTLADQRAFFVQTELLRFKARKYAHNPKVFANAMAGLPTIGCRHSFRICSNADSPLWPTHHFEVFKIIQRLCERRLPESELGFVDQFRKTIALLPRTVKVEKEVIKRYKLEFKTRDNYLRNFLVENWRYLRLAIEQVENRKVHPKALPYLIATRFFVKMGKPRTAEDMVLAEMEMLKE
jgi:hypothetical protein